MPGELSGRRLRPRDPTKEGLHSRVGFFGVSEAFGCANVPLALLRIVSPAANADASFGFAYGALERCNGIGFGGSGILLKAPDPGVFFAASAEALRSMATADDWEGRGCEDRCG